MSEVEDKRRCPPWLIMMSEIGLRSRMLVKDVMSSPVVTIEEDAPVNKTAELMEKHGLGCIIVTNKEGKPLGIITERDLVVRVLAKNVKPDSIQTKEVMTSPLITIEPDETISEAARRMSRLDIRRLGVVYRGQLIGLISSKDILAVMPELVETIQERALIEGENRAQEGGEESAPLAGYCDRCGGWSDNLKEVNGEYVCEDCRLELEEEEG
ncbi:MAG: CBS domain-containing protein [Candidatus Bathycorpusculaceae bacterium]